MRKNSIALSFMFIANACAQTISPPFDEHYVFVNLGSVPGVPVPYGGLTLHPSDPNLLLIGGNANQGVGAIYAIEIERDTCGQISGFVGNASLFATSPNIDGGLTFNDQGVLFAVTFTSNTMHQYLPGATEPTRTDDLTALGISWSTGSCNFVPAGFPGAGRFKVVSYFTGDFYDVTLMPDGSGTYNLGAPVLTAPAFTNGPEGFVYVDAGSPNFGGPSMIVTEYLLGSIAAFDVDALGNPIVGTRRSFMEGFVGAEGAFIDPATGNFLFGNFAGDGQVIVVRGFAAATDCDSIDYNNDGSFFDPQDIDAFLSVYSEGPCIPATATCNDIDFNNNGSCFDPADIDSFLSVFSEGPCI